MVEVQVLFVRAVAGLLEPQRRSLVDAAGLGIHHHLALEGLAIGIGSTFHVFLALVGLGAGIEQLHGVGHVAAVTAQHLAHAIHFEEFLRVLADMQDDIRAVLGALALAQLEGHAILADPVDRLRALISGQGDDLDLFADHEHRIEAQAKVTDNVALLLVALEVLHELRRTGERHLVDVTADFISGHADAGIGNGDGLFVLVDGDQHAHVLLGAVLHAELGDRVAGVGHHLTQEDILIGIQPALDDRHNVLRVDGYGTLFHIDCHK